jgi:hypothetical protein
VTLQGGDQYYPNWAEVERFAVPRPLFSENDHLDDADNEEPEVDSVAEETSRLDLSASVPKSPASSEASLGSASASPSSMQSMRSSISQISPPTSPKKESSSPAKPVTNRGPSSKAATSSSAMVPARLQPLFNYILWRIHQELDPVAALESFIFLCNDNQKVHYARGFDIKHKRLEQLREVVGREDRDYRNRMTMHNRENQQKAPLAVTVVPKPPAEDDEDDGEVVYTRRGGSPVMPAKNVMDPNAFSRAPQAFVQTTPIKASSVSPSFTPAQPARGGLNAPSFSPHGNNMRGNFRGGPRGRGNFSPGRGGFGNNRIPPAPAAVMQSNGQIDPDSFVRPRGGTAGRGGRKLWEPE